MPSANAMSALMLVASPHSVRPRFLNNFFYSEFFLKIPKEYEKDEKNENYILSFVFVNFFDLKVDFVELNLQSVALQSIFSRVFGI